MSFFELLRQILRSHPEGMTPQQLREQIKVDWPDHYGTESHRRNVEKGHYKNIDHALLAQIYVAAQSPQITQDKSQKPMRLLIEPGQVEDASGTDEEIDNEDLEKLEAGVGTMYVLETHLDAFPSSSYFTSIGKLTAVILPSSGSCTAARNV